MKLFFIALISFLWVERVIADPVVFEGHIGPYDIEAELSREGDSVVGRYRYAGRDSWLELSGETFLQDAIQLSEEVDGETTGAFYLAPVDEQFTGFWSDEVTSFEVELTRVAGGRLGELFAEPTVPEVGEVLTGRYSSERYWVNDLFAPNYEIAFNGGDVNVLRISQDLILVRFDFIVGPTYHIASFQGLARQTSGGVFVHEEIISGAYEPCRLVFEFWDGGLAIDDYQNGNACQFGARAHANFDLIKVDDTAMFESRW